MLKESAYVLEARINWRNSADAKATPKWMKIFKISNEDIVSKESSQFLPSVIVFIRF
jgi:hypothetical protein